MFEIECKTANQERVKDLLHDCAMIARQKGYKVPDVTHVDFAHNSVRSAGTAGQKGVHRSCQHDFEINLHGAALEHYGYDRFHKTAVHEFCHILQFVNYPAESKGRNGGNRVMHGSTFYMFMSLLGYSDVANSYHDFDLRAISGKKKRVQRRWEYKCTCGIHKIATVTHNRMQKKGMQRTCVDCRGTLTWTGKEIK